MKIDRSMFLAMTAALSAVGGGSACEVYVNRPPQAATPPPPAPPQTPSATPHAPTRIVQLRRGIPAAGTTPTPVPPSPTPVPVTSCLDSSAVAVADCAAMHAPDPSCSPFPFPQQKCGAYKTYFTAKVAAVAVSCMTSLTSKQVCDGSQTYGCGKAALAQACADPGVAQLCQVAATPCRTTPADCSAMISGLNDQGKQAVAQCVAQGCQAGLYSCIEGLGSATEGATRAIH